MDTKLKTYLHAFILPGCLSAQESFNTQKGMENIRIQPLVLFITLCVL